VPRRSNTYQKAIYLVQTHIAGEAIVSESTELPDIGTGTPREVDVCVECEVAGHEVVVSIECRDHARPQTVTWIEEMHTKHQRLRTNLLVLASSSGFSAEALRIAQLYGIVTVSSDDGVSDFGRRFREKYERIWFKTLHASPTQVRLSVEPTDGHPEEIVRAYPDNLVYLEDGTELCTVNELADNILNRTIEKNIEELLGSASGAEEFISGEWDLGGGSRTPEDAGPALYLKKLVSDGDRLRRITRINIVGTAHVGVSEVPLTHGELRGTAFAFGESKLDASNVILVLTADKAGRGRISLQQAIRDSPHLG
jgi:hypothetical protein